MAPVELTLDLPDELARKAQAAGLLNPEPIERLLREQLRKQAGEELRVMLNKIDTSGIPPMSEDEIQAEIDAYQAERLARLPKAQQRVVMQMLEGVLNQASR